MIPLHETCSCSGLRYSGTDQPVVSRQSLSAWVGVPFHDTCSCSGLWYSGAVRPVVSRQSSSLGQEFHFTIPIAVRASGYSGADHPVVSRQSKSARIGVSFHDTCSCSGLRPLWCRSARCQLTIAASQQRGFHFTIPIMRLSAGLRCRSLRCQLTIAASQQRGFHFTIPIAVPHSGTPVQITSLSADNHCLPGSEFYSTIPVAVLASGHSGADQPVVSRQLLPARVRIPFHDTCSTSGQRVLRRRSARCQLTIAASQQRGFHFTIPVALRASGYSGADQPVVSRQSSLLGSDFHFTIPVAVPASGYSCTDQRVVSRHSLPAMSQIPFHDTYS